MDYVFRAFYLETRVVVAGSNFVAQTYRPYFNQHQTNIDKNIHVILVSEEVWLCILYQVKEEY